MSSVFDAKYDNLKQQMKFSMCVSIMTQTLTLQDKNKVIPVFQHYGTDNYTSRQEIKVSPCVSIMTHTLTRPDNRWGYPVCQHYDTSRQQIKLSLCVSIIMQILTLQDIKWSYLCVPALWHIHWHFNSRDEATYVCQLYNTDIDTSRQHIKLSLCVSIMTYTLVHQDIDEVISVYQHYDTDYDDTTLCFSIMTLQDNKWSYPCVSALWHRQCLFKTRDEVFMCVSTLWHIHWQCKITDEATLSVSIMTLQDNKWSYPCVSALWHCKTTDEVISVYQHYDTDIYISRQQMKLSLCVNIMTQTLTLQDNRWSYSCVSALRNRHWHFKTTDKVILVCQHYDTDIDTSRQEIKLFLCVSIMTQSLTLQDKR